VFTINRKPRSGSNGNRVHDPPESAFTMDRNTQFRAEIRAQDGLMRRSRDLGRATSSVMREPYPVPITSVSPTYGQIGQSDGAGSKNVYQP